MNNHSSTLLGWLLIFSAVYSLVKMAGVSNFIVVTWTPEDLEACADLNLPCADAQDLLVQPLSHRPAPGDPSWLKPCDQTLLETAKRCCALQA
jgi:hypothetical protein